jgi:hypothetical protein
MAQMDMSQNDLLDLSDEDLTALPRLYYISKQMKRKRDSDSPYLTGASRLSVYLPTLYPTMEDLMKFVKTHQSMELVLDEKVWLRLQSEDKEWLARHKTANSNVNINNEKRKMMKTTTTIGGKETTHATRKDLKQEEVVMVNDDDDDNVHEVVETEEILKELALEFERMKQEESEKKDEL